MTFLTPVHPETVKSAVHLPAMPNKERSLHTQYQKNRHNKAEPPQENGSTTLLPNRI